MVTVCASGGEEVVGGDNKEEGEPGEAAAVGGAPDKLASSEVCRWCAVCRLCGGNCYGLTRSSMRMACVV